MNKLFAILIFVSVCIGFVHADEDRLFFFADLLYIKSVNGTNDKVRINRKFHNVTGDGKLRMTNLTEFVLLANTNSVIMGFDIDIGRRYSELPALNVNSNNLETFLDTLDNRNKFGYKWYDSDEAGQPEKAIADAGVRYR